jgi:hypothetical protein
MFDSTFSVGKYLVTPLTRQTECGGYIASVSIRRGVYDRVIRFFPRFPNRDHAERYAAREGHRMALQNQLA